MWTPLHFAAQKGYNRICKLLIEAGSPVTALSKVILSFIFILSFCL